MHTWRVNLLQCFLYFSVEVHYSPWSCRMTYCLALTKLTAVCNSMEKKTKSTERDIRLQTSTYVWPLLTIIFLENSLQKQKI